MSYFKNLSKRVNLLGACVLSALAIQSCVSDSNASSGVFAGQIAEDVPIAEVIASNHDGNEPSNTIDGEAATRWSAQGDGQWIRFDLGATLNVPRVDIAWYKGDQRRQRFDIELSIDGMQFTKVYSGESSGSNTTFESYTFTAANARYVRIVGHLNDTNDWNSITEVAVFANQPDTQAPTPEPNPPTLPPETPPAPGPSIKLPSDVLNLTNWKITLPFDGSDEDKKADEIKQPALRNYQHAKYFFVNAGGSSVAFRGYTTNVTTSNSKYPRSELRERTNNGGTDAEWSTSAGVHTMVVTEAITHLPSKQPELVAAQIHDGSDDLIMVRLEGKRLIAEAEDSKKEWELDANYVLGTVFTIKLVAGQGKVLVYYNNVLKVTYVRSAKGCYFKAGCYTQSNYGIEGTDTQYGEVVIYGLQVTHQ